MKLLININQAIIAILDNKFRAGVTIIIIALGITALIGVLTSIDGIKNKLKESFAGLGAETFEIVNWGKTIQVERKGRRRNQYFPDITYREVEEFKKRFQADGWISTLGVGTSVAKVTYQQQSTNQNIRVYGTDPNYLQTAQYTIKEGRNLNGDDIDNARNVAIIGSEVKEILFPFGTGLDELISANNRIYKVIGVLDKIGSGSGDRDDKVILLPITTMRRHYPNHGSLRINIKVRDAEKMDAMVDNATGAFRLVRKLSVREENDFSIRKSEAIIENMMSNLVVLTFSAQVIAIITLLGASIALLNVMLVSVTERTSEIGLRKALGATNNNIRIQFIVEAIMICQLGGFLGIALGLTAGNLFSTLLLESGFFIPWIWILIGVLSCLTVGVVAGYYPASKAAKVDPIESLRYE